MKRLLTISLFVLITKISFGQNKSFSVNGKLIDSDTKQPIEYVSVAIFKLPDSTLVTGCVTNSKGEFNIANLGNGKYFIKASFIGYENAIRQVEVNGSSVNIIEPIMMKPAALTIGEVTVNGTRSEKQQNIEKTTINVAKNIASVSGNITDVLKGQPGINIDNEANVYIRGNKNILILSA
ncbi:MAG TPA: carboxypeptidase-like regulatory domain-containing protein [Bacteroidales bacterium]|nr:carboxypeptidase-like regulatory domain-containing protein [Bacteroidales bacterium]